MKYKYFTTRVIVGDQADRPPGWVEPPGDVSDEKVNGEWELVTSVYARTTKHYGTLYHTWRREIIQGFNPRLPPRA